MAGGTGGEGDDERRARRARSTRDRRGRTGASDGNPRATRRTRKQPETAGPDGGDSDRPTSRGRRPRAGSTAGEAVGGGDADPGDSDRTGPRGRRPRAGAAGDGPTSSHGGDAGSDPAASRARQARGDADRPASGARSTRAGGAADAARGAAGSRGRTTTRRRGEPARPDSANRTTRGRTGRTDRDAGRPAARRPRSDAVRARRSEPGERPAPTRARYLTRRWMAVLVALSVVAVAYLVMFTSVLGVRSVEVVGVKAISKDAVIKAAAIEHGTPMVRLDADEAAARVARLPRVFEVRVERSWPSTVEIIIVERSPVAMLRAGSEIHLVDETGLDYAKVTTPPTGLPTLAMSNVHPDNPATVAAVTVLGAIPKQLKDQVVTVAADTPGDVRLTLADGRVVKWGNAKENARKAAVLAALLTRPGRTYDVATPDFPTVSG